MEIAEPFVVRFVEGKIESEGGHWPDDTFVEIDLRAIDSTKLREITKGDQEGRFRIANVPAGSYCFKAKVPGWQSTVGEIIVAPKADPEARVTFVMALGV